MGTLPAVTCACFFPQSTSAFTNVHIATCTVWWWYTIYNYTPHNTMLLYVYYGGIRSKPEDTVLVADSQTCTCTEFDATKA